MKHLILISGLSLALLTLTGCGGNQAQQAAANQAANQGQQAQANPAGNPTEQPQLLQQSVRPTPLRALGSTNTNLDFKAMTDEQIDQKYDQLKQSSPPKAVNYGKQAWASRFPEAANKKPADNSWSMGVLERNRNSSALQTTKSEQRNITGEAPPLLASSL